MDALFIYLAKASGLTAVFFIAYYALLKKETFFTSNRMFLLAGLFTSALLPLLSYTKVIRVTPQPALPMQQINIDQLMMVAPEQAAPPESFAINWLYIALAIYAIGIVFFMVRFITDLFKVKQLLRNQKVTYNDGYTFIDSGKVRSPFSFFKYIVYNSAQLQPEELNSIIAHEKVHSSQGHTLDILACQVFCIAFWFNPFAWLYKKAVAQNLEFIADAEATKRLADKKAYQKTLLKITLHPECISITNHFYQSLIKKRIVMLNKQQSKRRNSLKYAVVIPVLAAFIVLFQVEVVAQEKENTATTGKENTAKPGNLKISMDVNKDATNEELKKEKEIFKQEFGTDVDFSNIKRNGKGELIAIKVTVTDKNSDDNGSIYEVTSDTAIKPFSINVEREQENGMNHISFNMPIGKNTGTKITAGNISVTDTILYGHKEKLSERQKDSINGHWSVNSMKFKNDDALIIINGVKQKKGEPIEISLDEEIDKLDVLKNDDAKKYGGTAEKGVILITTKKIKEGEKSSRSSFNSNNYKVSSSWYQSSADAAPLDAPISERVKMNTTGPVRVSHSTVVLKPSVQIDIKDILKDPDHQNNIILIDLKKATIEELENLNPNDVITSGRMPGSQALADAFGDKALNGFIIIKTKATAGNTGVIINRNMKNSELDAYAASLKQDCAVTMKYSRIKRNKEGVITSIRVELVDKNNGTKEVGEYANDNGIPDIYAGRKNGELAVYAKR